MTFGNWQLLQVRELMNGTLLPNLLKAIFDHSKRWGASIYEKGAALLTEFIHQEPGCMPQVISLGVAKSVLDSISGDFPLSRGVVNMIPAVLGALCLSQAGLRIVEEVLNPTPYTLQPTTYTLHPTPYTLHPTPNTLHPTPYTLHPTPGPAPNPKPESAKIPKPESANQRQILSPKAQKFLSPKAKFLSLKTQSRCSRSASS